MDLLFSKEDILKSLKTHNFKNEYKDLNKLLKKATSKDLILEEKTAVFKIGNLKGNATSIGVNKNEFNPDFSLKLNLEFSSNTMVGLIEGDKAAASNYAYINGYYNLKVDPKYPFYLGNEKAGYDQVSDTLFKAYYDKLGLGLESIKINKGSFITTSDKIEHKIMQVYIVKNGTLKELSTIAYIVYSDKELKQQEIVLIDYRGE